MQPGVASVHLQDAFGGQPPGACSTQLAVLLEVLAAAMVAQIVGQRQLGIGCPGLAMPVGLVGKALVRLGLGPLGKVQQCRPQVVGLGQQLTQCLADTVVDDLDFKAVVTHNEYTVLEYVK
jgi:hypothetical protein